MIANILQWCSLGIATASAGFAIVKTVKAGKKDKIVKLAKVVQTIPEAIIEAEQILGPGTGKAKLTYVLNKLNIKCLQAGIEFDERGLTAEVEKVLSTPQKGTGFVKDSVLSDVAKNQMQKVYDDFFKEES